MLIDRFVSCPEQGTFGRLHILGHTFYTVEKPWADNAPFKSCVPEGDYALVPFVSGRFGNTFALHNPELNVYSHKDYIRNNDDRWACLIHSANLMTEVLGCIAPGMSLGAIGNEWAVKNSGTAMRGIKELWNQQQPTILKIRNLFLTE